MAPWHPCAWPMPAPECSAAFVGERTSGEFVPHNEVQRHYCPLHQLATREPRRESIGDSDSPRLTPVVLRAAFRYRQFATMYASRLFQRKESASLLRASVLRRALLTFRSACSFSTLAINEREELLPSASPADAGTGASNENDCAAGVLSVSATIKSSRRLDGGSSAASAHR